VTSVIFVILNFRYQVNHMYSIFSSMISLCRKRKNYLTLV